MTKESEDFRQAAEQILNQLAAEIRDGIGLIRAAGAEEMTALKKVGEETERMVRVLPNQLKAEMVTIREALTELVQATGRLKYEVEALRRERQSIMAPPAKKRRIFGG